MISLTLCKAKAHTRTHWHTHAERRGGANGCRGSRRERERGPTLWAAGWGLFIRVQSLEGSSVLHKWRTTPHIHITIIIDCFSLLSFLSSTKVAQRLYYYFFCACASDAHERPVHQLFTRSIHHLRAFVIIIVIISCCLITSSQSPRKRTLKSDSMGILQGDSPTPGPAMYWVSLLSLDF